jgi:membrane fusion protein (multidrug efflux system)
VVTIQPQRLIMTTELTGRTSADRTAEVRPQVSGIILKRLFVEGSNVKAGQALYQIDPTPFQAALDNAAASLVAAQKAVDRARAALSASSAAVIRQQALADLARINSRRYEEAFKDRAVSESVRDQTATDVSVAVAALHASEAQVESDQKAVAVAEANVKQAQAALKTTQINLDYTTVTASISGHIGRSSVTEGALVSAYQPLPLATIQQLDVMYVDVPQSTTDVLRLRRRLEEGKLHRNGALQHRVRLILEDGSPCSQEGKLQFQDVTVEPTTGSVNLRVVVPNPRGILLPGMFIRAIVEEGVNPAAILVPQQAVSRTQNGTPFVLLVDAAGKVEQRMLSLDRAIGAQWLVVSGLAAKERVIVEGIQMAKPGLLVKVVPFEDNSGKNSGNRKSAVPPPGKANGGA